MKFHVSLNYQSLSEYPLSPPLWRHRRQTGGGRTCYYCNVVTQYTGEPAGRDHRDPRLLGRRREKTRVVRIITVIKMKYRGVMSSRRGRSARTE